MSEYENSADDPDTELHHAENADDMLLNAELRIGGALGIGTPGGTAYLAEHGWTGPSGCLSAKGFARARALQNAYWGDR